MKKFTEEFQTGQPSLRIGERVASTDINLAFFNAPIMTPENTLQLFDRSTSIPENTSIVNLTQSDMYSNTSGMLVPQAGEAKLPMRNIIVTNKYAANIGNTPLFYVATARFDHWEAGITQMGTFKYTGQNIKVLENGQPTTKTFEIYLTQNVTPNTYSLVVYSEFTPSEDVIFHIEYDKYIGGSVTTNYREVMNASPIFTESSNKATVVGGLANAFFVEKDDDDSGFYIYAANAAETVAKPPIEFRWRVLRDGVAGPWSYTSIHNKLALQTVEWTDQYGGRYIDRGGRAEKFLVKPKTHFVGLTDGDSTTYSIQCEALTSGYTSADIKLSPSTITGDSDVYVYTDKATGLAQSEINKFSKEYPSMTYHYKIVGTSSYPSPLTTATTVNAASSINGATISSNAAATGHTVGATDAGNAIDGIRPAEYANSLDKLFGMNTCNIYKAYSGTTTNSGPPNDVTVTVTFNTTRNIHAVDVRMGDKGTPKSYTLYGAGNTVLKTEAMTFDGYENNQRVWRNQFAVVSGAVRMDVVITPTKWRTRDANWFQELFGQKDEYKSGFELHEINAFEFQPATFENKTWAREVVVGVNVSASGSSMRTLDELITEYGLDPNDDNHRQFAEYEITPLPQTGDGKATVYLKNNADIVYNSKVRYANKANHKVVVSTDKYDLKKSYRYTIQTVDSDNIFIRRPGYQHFNEWWGLDINNGTVLIKIPGPPPVTKEYYVREFGTQAFEPALPYIKVVDEKAKFVDNRTIAVSNKNLYVKLDSNKKPDIVVTRNGVELGIKDWNRYSGEIYLTVDVEFNDDILVTYSYEANTYKYRGYAVLDGSTEKFYYLDLNPMPGHIYTDNDGVEQPSSGLVDKIVYIYMLPTYVSGSTASTSGSTIRHAVYPESTTEADAVEDIQGLSTAHANAQLLGKVLVRSIHTPSTLTVIDSRRRGGGFSDKLSLEAIKSLINESDAIWDVTSWDGHPYPSNGVGIITLPKTVLAEHGGNLTEQEVRDLVNKYIAFGVYAIIRYK